MFFLTFSCDDTHWPELLRALSLSVDGVERSDASLAEPSINER